MITFDITTGLRGNLKTRFELRRYHHSQRRAMVGRKWFDFTPSKIPKQNFTSADEVIILVHQRRWKLGKPVGEYSVLCTELVVVVVVGGGVVVVFL